MAKKQIKFVAVNEFEDIRGPVGDTYGFVKEALIIGYRRSITDFFDKCVKSDAELWDEIIEKGYRIKKVKIIIIE